MLHISSLSHDIDKRQVLQRIDLRLEMGEIHGVVGPNGAGKSTLFGLIAGEHHLQSGSIKWKGEAIGHLPMWKRVRLRLGYLPQRSLGFDSMSALENLKMIPNVQDERIFETLEQLGLMGVHLQALGTLSGGERRRLDIGRLMLLDSQLWILDEPFAALDWESISWMQSFIISAKEKGVGVLVTDHALAQMLPVLDHLSVLQEGRIVLSGSVDEVRRMPIFQQRYSGI